MMLQKDISMNYKLNHVITMCKLHYIECAKNCKIPKFYTRLCYYPVNRAKFMFPIFMLKLECFGEASHRASRNSGRADRLREASRRLYRRNETGD